MTGASGIQLRGKVAIVTGASRGIGEAIARLFVESGAQVVIAARKIDPLLAIASSVGPSAHPIAAHTGKEDDCKRLVAEAVARFGKLDILINNAATNPYFGPMLDVDGGAWDKTFDVNLKGYGRHRERCQCCRPRSCPTPGCLRHDKGRHPLDDQDSRLRARQLAHPGQRYRARSGGYPLRERPH